MLGGRLADGENKCKQTRLEIFTSSFKQTQYKQGIPGFFMHIFSRIRKCSPLLIRRGFEDRLITTSVTFSISYNKSRSMSRREEVIDLTSDNEETASGTEDEDEDLKRAIALSLEDHQNSLQISKTDLSKKGPQTTSSQGNSRIDSENKIADAEKSDKPLSLMAALDRKQMEAERLARLKRKRGEEDTGVHRTVSPPPLRRTTQPLPLRTDANASANAKSNHEQPEICRLPYADGKVFLTSVERSYPGSNAISMPDLLKPPDATFRCKSVLLSTFISDFNWLFPHFETQSTTFMLVLHAASPEHKQLLTGDFAGIPNVRLVFPQVGGLINCMHSKLMLLFYQKKDGHESICRLVIPTANLTPADWGVQSVMENAVFVVDLPQAEGKKTDTGVFKENLVQFLRAQQIPETVILKLDDFDLSSLKYGFVHTIGGAHMLQLQAPKASIGNFFSNSNSAHAATKSSTDQSKTSSSKLTPALVPSQQQTRTGLHSLSDAIKSLGLAIPATSALPKLDYITSSLGNLKTPFLQSLFLACCGRAPESPIYSSASSRSKTSSNLTVSLPTDQQIQSNLQIYFPSDQTVKSSRGGPNAAGTICFQSKWWNNAGSDFPKKSLRDCVGARGDGTLMHSKVSSSSCLFR